MPWLHQGPDSQTKSGQTEPNFLQTSGPRSQTEPATFSSGSVWFDFVWLSGLGVASPLEGAQKLNMLINEQH